MTENRKYDKVLFVCTGNTCRSPMAEVIFRNLSYDLGIEACSRGIIVLFPEPSNPKAELVLKNHDMNLENHVATQLTREDITDKTLVLTMTESHKAKILEEYGPLEQVYSIKEFAGEEGDVVDPYGGDLMDYESCFGELSRLIKKTVLKLNDEAAALTEEQKN